MYQNLFSYLNTTELLRLLYRDDTEYIAIIMAANGKFFNRYGYDLKNKTSTCTAGAFDTLDEAVKALEMHRPMARQINSICYDCKTEDCAKSTELVWTGCVYRKI